MLQQLKSKAGLHPTTEGVSLGWIVLALGAHTGWGSQPVLSRYLQTVSNLPSMSILIFGNLIMLLFLLLTVGHRLRWHHFRSPMLWGFAIVVAMRGTTNLLSTYYTLAIYVQLIMLMTPFFVALLSLLVLHERLPPYTGRAILLASGGAILMIIGGNLEQAAWQHPLTANDWLGMGLAAFSTLCLATYMILVRSTRNHKIPGEAVLVVQAISLILFSSVVAWVRAEDWSRWAEIGLTDWLVFAAFTGGVYIGANFSQVAAIRHLGAPLVGSLLPWRMVVALVLGALLVGEYLTSAWQVLGALLVLLTISWYLWQQRPTPPP